MANLDLSVDGTEIRLTAGGRPVASAAEPVRVAQSGGGSSSTPYSAVERGAGSIVGTVEVASPDGTRVQVRDEWRVNDEGDGVLITRSWTVAEQGTDPGVRVELLVSSTLESRPEDWQYFVSTAMYNHNDTDGDGEEDYLGTFVQEYRDDRNGHLAVLARSTSTGIAVSLARVTPPTFDETVDDEGLVSGVVVQNTDIGSLGLIPKGESLTLRAGYPFGEEVTFTLETSGRGWQGFLPTAIGAGASVTYELRAVETEDLTEAMWDLTQRQIARLGTVPPPLPLPLDELAAHRFQLTQQFFRSWTKEEDPNEPAGYMTHFSPRRGETQGSLIEFGFTGAQALHALNAIRRGNRENVPMWTARAVKVIDFFTRHMQQENGFSEGIYDLATKSHVRWFTGILLPFQYSDDLETARGYLGSQMTDALGAIAARLRTIPGNYMRTMCDAMYPILLAYEEERERGVVHENWVRAGVRFGEFLLANQGEDGSWHRGHAPDGAGLTEPVEWFGSNDVERKSGTIFPSSVLAVLYRITGEERYRAAALRAADFIERTYVDEVLYLGGLNDTSHIKSAKIDAVGVMFAMRSLLVAFELSNDPRHLAAAVKAAKVLASWMFLWDVPFPAGTLLESGGFRTTGWLGCDVIPAGGYVDNEFLEFVPDIVKIGVSSGTPELVDIAQIGLHGMQYGLSIPSNMLGYAAPGIQCEGYMTSYWLSAPDATAFSGAVGKTKGDDNDTCNGLINAQALYGLDTLRREFGTVDLGSIRPASAGAH